MTDDARAIAEQARAIHDKWDASAAHLAHRNEGVCQFCAPIAAALSAAREAGAQEIDCPACGTTVKLVASATLNLALWQHWNWVCPKRDECEAGRQHRCSGCDLRWTDLPGVELCGDCWRERQAALEAGRQQGMEEAATIAARTPGAILHGVNAYMMRESIVEAIRAAAPRPQGEDGKP